MSCDYEFMGDLGKNRDVTGISIWCGGDGREIRSLRDWPPRHRGLPFQICVMSRHYAIPYNQVFASPFMVSTSRVINKSQLTYCRLPKPLSWTWGLASAPWLYSSYDQNKVSGNHCSFKFKVMFVIIFTERSLVSG